MWNQLDPELLRRGLRQPEPVTSTSPGRRAAIALLLRSASGDVEVLLMRRVERIGDPWSGHMSLPGGFEAPPDTDLLQTALRETREEVGVDLSQSATPLGRLDDVVPMRSLDVVVRPFAFALHGNPTLHLGPEVDEIFWAKMRSLASGQVRVEHAITLGEQRLSVPAFRFGDRVVWGLTYRVITTFLDRTAHAWSAAELP